jgi:hypothetical protein
MFVHPDGAGPVAAAGGMVEVEEVEETVAEVEEDLAELEVEVATVADVEERSVLDLKPVILHPAPHLRLVSSAHDCRVYHLLRVHVSRASHGTITCRCL